MELSLRISVGECMLKTCRNLGHSRRSVYVPGSRSRSRSRIIYYNTSYRKVYTLPPSCPGCYADRVAFKVSCKNFSRKRSSSSRRSSSAALEAMIRNSRRIQRLSSRLQVTVASRLEPVSPWARALKIPMARGAEGQKTLFVKFQSLLLKMKEKKLLKIQPLPKVLLEELHYWSKWKRRNYSRCNRYQKCCLRKL